MTEEKEENKSVLKSKLGLDNLKGLGDTLKQIKEVKESLDEAQKTIGDLAKDNSPLGKALAQLVEAHGLKTLNEDNFNVSEEVRKTMQEELKNKETTIEELEAENKSLKEDKQVREFTETVRVELDKRLPKPGGESNGSGEGKLMKALESVAAEYLEKRLSGGGDGTLTSAEIRSVIKEEMAAVDGGKKKPEDMIDDLVNTLTIGDKLREKLGVAGIGGRLLHAQGGDSGLRTDLVKVILEDDRERVRIQQEHEDQMQKNRHIGTLADAVKDNLGTRIAAISAAAEEIKTSSGTKTSSPPPPQSFACGDCQTKFGAPEGWAGQPLTCPGCGREYTKEELAV